ncbi:sugar-binding protein [Mucilaginibacter sp. SG564]|uniref:sugar-binding protein n=1 Tax=Mucilaginibacter sp. SG564 TaxID=2587022 RepID=UPI001552D64C|nr:sugar-binding protein [Mucilaginibacter sp. SG564]NOW95019.1 hypothetical protein [Mucilaginibacter sp. SG564]
MDKGIFVAAYYDPKQMTSPRAFGKDDLLQSPIGVICLKSLYIPDFLQKNLYSSSPDLLNTLTNGANTPYHLILSKELIANSRLYKAIGKREEAQKLFKIYGQVIKDKRLLSYLDTPPIADIDYISNDLNQMVPFEMKKEGEVQIFAGGQVLSMRDYNSTPYNYDNIQIFYNGQDDSTKMNSRETGLIEFNYRFDKIRFKPNGDAPEIWIPDSLIKYHFSDPSRNEYILETKIPWKQLGRADTNTPAEMRMNIFIGDSDLNENTRDGILSWCVKKDEWYNDPHSFGSIIFKEKSNQKRRRKVCSRQTNTAPVIDGIIDAPWDQVAFENITEPFYGDVAKSVIAGKFKMLYDHEYIYMLFCITDNCKNKTGVLTRDKCWIEDASNGSIIWKMNGEINDHYPSFYVEDKISLSPGKYKLRYTSDGAHSLEGWYGNPPENDFYGVQLYRSK